MALIALLEGCAKGRSGKAASWRWGYSVGAFYGDGMITPEISVISAVEGLQVAPPLSNSWYPITVACYVLLAIRRCGDGAVGRPSPGWLWVRRLALSGAVRS